MTDLLEDRGAFDHLDVDRRQFLALAHGFGASAALGAVAGCTGGGGGTPEPETVIKTKIEERTVVKTATERQQEASQGDLDTVRASVVPVITSIPLLIGQNQGFFEEEGIELTTSTAVSASKETAGLATGQIDLAGGSIGASTVNAINRGIGLRVAAERLRMFPGLPHILQWEARPDIYEDGMTLADGEGLTWVTNATDNVSHYMMGRALEVHGLSFDDIEHTTLPFPQMVSALEGGSADFVMIIGALAAKARAQGVAEHLEYVSRANPNGQVAGMIAGAPFLNQRPDVAKRFFRAYVRSIRQYFEWGPYSDEVINVFTTETDSPAVIAENSPIVMMHQNGQVNADDLMRQVDFFNCLGSAESTVSEDQLIDTSLLDEAVDELGAVDDPLMSQEEFDAIMADAPSSLPPMQDVNEPEATECGGAGPL